MHVVTSHFCASEKNFTIYIFYFIVLYTFLFIFATSISTKSGRIKSTCVQLSMLEKVFFPFKKFATTITREMSTPFFFRQVRTGESMSGLQLWCVQLLSAVFTTGCSLLGTDTRLPFNNHCLHLQELSYLRY